MDWQRFLDENNVHYITRGPNTKKGELSIKCPMCGDDDPSEHLGINLTSGHWGCHRDPAHRGKSPRTLIKALLHCNSNLAEDIRRQYSRPDPNDLDSALAALTGLPDGDAFKQVRKQKSPEVEFKDFNVIKPRGVTKKFFTYLQGRGFDNPQELIERYDLRCALTGRYQDRVIVPVSLNGELLGWTSRAIGPSRFAPRYLASSEDVKATVFNYDELKKGGQRLFIVEGPFDALKMDNFSMTHGDAVCKLFSEYDNRVARSPRKYRVTCTFGTSPTISQIALLRNLVKQFAESYVLFDYGADAPAENLAGWIGAKTAKLPMDHDDPGELDPLNLIGAMDGEFNRWFQYYNVHSYIEQELFGTSNQERARRRYHYPYL